MKPHIIMTTGSLNFIYIYIYREREREVCLKSYRNGCAKGAMFERGIIRYTKVCAKLIPRLVNNELKERRMEKIIDCLKTEPDLLHRHHWWWGIDFLVTNRKPSSKAVNGTFPTSLRPKKARQSNSKVKIILIPFFNLPRWIVAIGPDKQSANLQEDPVIYGFLSMQKATRVYGRWLLYYDDATAHNCEHPVVPGQKEYRRNDTPSLFSLPCSVWL